MIAHQNFLLKAKLQHPSSSSRLVLRRRLLEQLNQGLERELTLVSAPAGSGKTTLLTQWLEIEKGKGRHIAWISLDEGDNDPMRFWHYVCAALEQVYPEIGEQQSLLLEAIVHSSEALLTQMINLLLQADLSLVLVLDDYHHITDERISQALTFLLQHMPTHLHLVLLTRFDPPLPLARLRVRGQIMDIREGDLRFLPDEVECFFTDALQIVCASRHIQALIERTEGWAAGLQLVALAMQKRPDIEEFISSFTGSNRYIVDYLLEEVIEHQSEDIQTFLLYTSVLERLCAPLCASVLGNVVAQEASRQGLAQGYAFSRQSQNVLEYLERTNVFLVPLDQERRWYRYHHLFAEAMRARLALLHPELVAELHMRASLWYEQNGLLSEAIEHALMAQDQRRAASLLETLANFSPTRVSPQVLLRWMQTLSAAEIRSRPRLSLFYAWLLTLSDASQGQSIERWFEEAMQGLCQDQPVPENWATEVAAVRLAITSSCEKHGNSSLAEIKPSRPQALLDPLSERELEVLQALAGGATNLAIAHKLIIASGTVKRHLSNIFSKLGAANRIQAVAYARDLGLL